MMQGSNQEHCDGKQSEPQTAPRVRRGHGT